MKRGTWLVAVLCALVLVCAGCGSAPQTQSRTVTDMTGRNVVLDEDVTRAVALTAADCEIIYAIGAEDALVGRGEYCDYPTDALSLPEVQSGAETYLCGMIARALVPGVHGQRHAALAHEDRPHRHGTRPSSRPLASPDGRRLATTRGRRHWHIPSTCPDDEHGHASR